MIQFKSLKQYTHIVDGVRYPIDPKNPFALVYLSENSNLLDDYMRLNIRITDVRQVVVPLTTVPRTRLTPDLRTAYRRYKLLPIADNQKVQSGQNAIYDLSQFTNGIDYLLKPLSYRQRAGSLLMSGLNKAFSFFPDNYQKTLVYGIDLTKDFNKFTARKIFPVLRILKDAENLNFDHLLVAYMYPSSVRYRLLIKDGDYQFQRVVNYFRIMQPTATQEEEETKEASKASNIVMRVLSKKLSNPSAIKDAVKNYLEDNPDEAIRINSGDAKADDITKLVSTSILNKLSGNEAQAKMIVNKVPKNKLSKFLQAVDKSLGGDLLKPEKTIDLSLDPTIQSYMPSKMVDEKSPEHILQKRQIDFSKNLKKDLMNSFKVLENKEVPLKVVSLTFKDKKPPAGELEVSDKVVAVVILKDETGREQEVNIELPKIDPDTGTFRLNGRRKCLINQIVQNPITFPKPGWSRFESSYSVFTIKLKKLKRRTYLDSFMGGVKLPLFYMLAFGFGFEETMKEFKIKYEVTEQKPAKGELFEKVNKTQYIIFKNVDSDLKKHLISSFIHGNPSQFDIIFDFPSKEYFEDYVIKFNGRINAPFNLQQNLENVVDPVAKQVLLTKQLPTKLDKIMKYMAEKVIDGFTIPRNDLSNQRLRNSEVLVHLAQKQILTAYTNYREQYLSGNKEATFNFVPTKVLSDFLKTELVVDMEYANPLEELGVMMRISPSGKKVGGIPDSRAISEVARNLDPSYFGNIDPLDTPEGGNIGIVQQLTVDALLSSSRGIFGTKNVTNTEYAGILSPTAAMVPFVDNTDGARMIMATNQAKQMLPLKNPEPPIVMSGYESVLTNSVSENFVKRAPCDGKITKITHDEIRMKCSTGRLKSVDISPMHLRSGSGKNTLSVFNPTVKVGEVVKNKSVIAEGACMSQGSISLGRPLLTAMMPYKGYNFEDGLIINETLVSNNKLTSLHGIEEEVLVSENDRVLEIAEVGATIKKGEPLIRKTIGEIEELIGIDDDESTDVYAGQFIKKSPGGRIVDVLVFSNVGEDAFPKLKPLIERTNRKYGRLGREKFKVKGNTIKGILVRFRLEQELPIELGDKLANRYGNKGIISLVEKDENMPRTPWGERVELIANPLGLLSRMNLGQLYELYCGLMSKELGKRIPSMPKAKAIELIESIYGKIDKSKNREYTKTLVKNLQALSSTKYSQFTEQIKKRGFYPFIIPPFKAPNYKDIKAAMSVLGLKTGYNLKLPEYNTTTDKPVPIGYMYIAKLEHLADAKIHSRSTGPVTQKTAQPTAGKRREGGQRVGEADTYCFISYDCPSVLAEFMGPLSDDYITKEEIISEIVQNGSATYKEPKLNPARDLLNSYFISLMLTRG